MTLPAVGRYWVRIDYGNGPEWQIAAVEDNGEAYTTGTDCPFWPRELRSITEWRPIEPPTD